VSGIISEKGEAGIDRENVILAMELQMGIKIFLRC
jgi:hypothetical protein